MEKSVSKILALSSIIAVFSATTTHALTTPVWSDPTAGERIAWIGTWIIAASIVYIILSLLVLFTPIKKMRGETRFILVIAGWILLFTVQLSYLTLNPIIVYAVIYDEASGSIKYLTRENPMAVPVSAMTIATALIVWSAVIASYIIHHARELRRLFLELT